MAGIAKPDLPGQRKIPRAHGEARSGTRQERSTKKPLVAHAFRGADGVALCCASIWCEGGRRAKSQLPVGISSLGVSAAPGATNLSLRETTARVGVSPGRISQIQQTIEVGKPAPELATLIQKYKVKACRSSCWAWPFLPPPGPPERSRISRSHTDKIQR